MHPLPHQYQVDVSCSPTGSIAANAPNLPELLTDAPAEFDGPGNHWSPESLLVAALADCFALTFRAVAKASNLAWSSLTCTAAGVLDKPERTMQFTAFTLHARLVVSPGTREATAQRALEKAEQNCLVSNSLAVPITLHSEIQTEDA